VSAWLDARTGGCQLHFGDGSGVSTQNGGLRIALAPHRRHRYRRHPGSRSGTNRG